MNFISCLSWIKRGVAKPTPEKVHLSKDDLKKLINETKQDIKDVENENGDLTVQSVDESAFKEECVLNDEDISLKYDLDNYDVDDSSNPMVNLADLTVFANNEDDPYITLKDKEDDTDDDEDFHIRPTDNLVAVGRVHEDCSVLEIYVYNEEEDDLYVHHDTILPAYPLALEWLNFDPSEETPGNYIAVGDMTPVIRIWDIDVVDALEPAYTLGKTAKKKKKAKSKYCGHSEAVLDISWNKHIRHNLASGSADYTTLIWDISEEKPVTKFEKNTEKVQSVKWHPFESQILLTGSCDKTVRVFDCRNKDDTHKCWLLDGEIEKVIWDHFNPFFFLASTDKGSVYCLDARNDKPVYVIKAHFEAVTGLSLSTQCAGCLVTASTDGTIKIWDISNNHPDFIEEKKLNVGSIHALALSTDSPFLFAAGGDDRSNNFTVWDFGNMKSVSTRFAHYINENLSKVQNETELMETDLTTDEMQNLRLNNMEMGIKPKKKFRQFKSIKPK
ncbi:periodic tryptophan protein 1 homolog [Centruroides sculpturatus]|uniref:periodic tryptophan protein 1 homolog n=1 Tax=Centruroides sculpturatus TaxID=218467 RepID=UPI000C6D97F2|nr:periodic tryptophan protein 1 homolog [Centruroides sculpturatus]XP_023227047.1 periodic tryptophan protein 1 homolog [Centruroides sculpturatus]